MDQEIESLHDNLLALGNFKRRIAKSVRNAIDHALNGPVTGYYDIDDLSKPKKSTIGVSVEDYIRFNFEELGRSHHLDFKLGGIDFDCKYSISRGWMIPEEAFGEICLIITSDDECSTFKVGLIRTERDILTGRNRDKKRGISSEGVSNTKWIHRGEGLPRNVLLNLDDQKMSRIREKDSGQKRITEFFRVAQEVPINLRALKTVAAPKDNRQAARRARDARETLEDEDIKVLTGGQSDHTEAARAAGVDLPDRWRVSVPARKVSGYDV
ncbi:NaeI family type II restriction endonuclease [Salinibacter ruber]|uniref:NaeI family type II restriction endonuclease n=1 Tax=Salinibacter ruber TaxID=146919 RepID=UPI002167A717|nr:NaeI family type II restriction endonuclease [Salinibacter ruber]MCS3782674.1 hypothetical protein [Salinibacter ruber]